MSGLAILVHNGEDLLCALEILVGISLLHFHIHTNHNLNYPFRILPCTLNSLSTHQAPTSQLSEKGRLKNIEFSLVVGKSFSPIFQTQINLNIQNIFFYPLRRPPPPHLEKTKLHELRRVQLFSFFFFCQIFK